MEVCNMYKNNNTVKRERIGGWTVYSGKRIAEINKIRLAEAIRLGDLNSDYLRNLAGTSGPVIVIGKNIYFWDVYNTKHLSYGTLTKLEKVLKNHPASSDSDTVKTLPNSTRLFMAYPEYLAVQFISF